MKLLHRLIAAAAALSICTAASTYNINAAPTESAQTYGSSYYDTDHDDDFIYEGNFDPDYDDTHYDDYISEEEYWENYDKEFCHGYKVFSTPDEAAEYVRSQMVLRNPNISFILPINKEAYLAIYYDIMKKALEETGIPDEGDYIRYNISSYKLNGEYGHNYMKMTPKITYRTTAEQEAAVASAVTQTLSELGVSQMNDYNKIYTIYDYVASNVEYDHGEDGIKYSAYGAMINKSAVCQGYSLLLYRMLTEAGIYNRIVEGTAKGSPHAWNIALLDGKYYYLDSTWGGPGHKYYGYPYFLKGSSDFDSFNTDKKHILSTGNPDSPLRNIDYTSEEFQAKYPIAETAFDVSKSKYLGDVDGDGVIAASDAAIVLNAYAEASATRSFSLTLPQKKTSDVNGDGKIDARDASLILKYYAAANKTGSASFDDFIE